MKALRPDIADWTIDTELLAVIAEGVAHVKIHRPGSMPDASVPAALPVESEPVGVMSSPEKVKAFFGGSVRYAPPTEEG